MLQYGVELNCLVFITALYAAEQLFRQGNRKALFGALAASLLLVPALYLLAGKSILFGKYPAAQILSRPDASELVLFLKSAAGRDRTEP